MDVVNEDVIDRASLAVGQNDSPADQLLLGSVQFTEDVHCSLFAVAHASDRDGARLRGGHLS